MESNNVNACTSKSSQNGETNQGRNTDHVRREMRSLGWKILNKETFGVGKIVIHQFVS